MTASATDVKRVLVADDELNMRRVLEAILRREGYDVITAANGIEALGGMKANVHTVITDLKMPGLDGMTLLKRLAVDYPDVPVVMITAHGSVENAVEAVKLGAFDYLKKPFEQEQIRQVVAKAINTYALSRRDARPEEPSRAGPVSTGRASHPPSARSTRCSKTSRTRRRRSSSRARRARARSWSRAPSTKTRRGTRARSSRSTAPRSRRR